MKGSLFILLLLSFLFYSCSDDKNPTEPENDKTILSDKISTGELTEEISQDISSNGGSLKINDPSSIINGFELTVPTDGYNESRTFSISTAPINGHKFGENFNPVSPMITITNGGGYSEMPMTIKVPVTKAEDEFMIGFLYNEISGELEALPVLELEESYIMVETRHFALSNVTAEVSLDKKTEISSQGNLVITSIKESLLSGKTIISSGFTPGVDDWEFINYGSYIASGGHCAGQSMTAMWYYYEKKLKGEPPLFHRFDVVNNSEKPRLLWQDNAVGYRFASTVQVDANWGEWAKALKLQARYPKLVWKAFIVAMLITGEPQSVIIRNSTDGGGHAMIIYKIDITQGKLYVADPNYPNNRASDGTESIRTITYSDGKLQPYPSFAKVGDPGKVYDQIAFYAKTGVFNWKKLGERYKELEAKTIGNDRFLRYDLFVKTPTSDISFLDGMTVTKDTLKIYCRNDKIPGFLPGTDKLQKIYLYNNSGNLIALSDDKGLTKLKLNEGENKFGIYICGYKNNKAYNFYDFKWVTVNYENSNPSPNDLNYNSVIVGAQVLANMHSNIDGEESTFEEVREVGSYSIPGSFSGNTYTGETEQFGSKQTITITLNDNHDMVTSVSFSSLNESSLFPGAFTSYSFTGSNIPVDPDDESKFELNGELACNSILSINYTSDNGGTARTTIQNHSCNDVSHIFISFRVK